MTKKVLIIDDEPYTMSWLEDFIKANGYEPTLETSFSSALSKIKEVNYFAASVVDMNIPIEECSGEIIKSKGDIYIKYPGLYLAHELRDYGNDKNSVILFTVHDNVEIAKIAEMLSIRYIIKGQARKIKEALKNQFSYLAKR